jgi:hypothetical protein
MTTAEQPSALLQLCSQLITHLGMSPHSHVITAQCGVADTRAAPRRGVCDCGRLCSQIRHVREVWLHAPQHFHTALPQCGIVSGRLHLFFAAAMSGAQGIDFVATTVQVIEFGKGGLSAPSVSEARTQRAI